MSRCHLMSLIFALSLTTRIVNSDPDDLIGDIPDDSSSSHSGMPAGMVLLLLFIFASLILICYREIRREYLSNQQYLINKANGIINNDSKISLSNGGYGSVHQQQLYDEQNGNDIDDNTLYNDNDTVIDQLNGIKSKIVESFVNYMEQTPEPVLFNGNPDKSISAFCDNPIIPSRPKPNGYKIYHSKDYNHEPSDALKLLMQSYAVKNKKRNQNNNNKNEDDKSEYIDIEKKNKNNDELEFENYGINHVKYNHIITAKDVNKDNNNNDSEYDAIPDDIDSDKELSDNDNGGKLPDPIPKMERKIVILDLD